MNLALSWIASFALGMTVGLTFARAFPVEQQTPWQITLLVISMVAITLLGMCVIRALTIADRSTT